uniref:MULE transposase domain-containing protein n=1 Tax=Arundo donax TaxID=35708 RepID=A0A0A9CTF0_ARUDO
MCGCSALMKIARSKNGGWYVKEHVAEHNHHLSETYADKIIWRSHQYIDIQTKQLIKHLRDNNVNLSKVYSIISSFFGSPGNAPFTKRAVRGICAKLARDNADKDVKKTLALFSKLEEDPNFMYNVEVDEKSCIKTLMWTNGRSRLQYEWFGDVITFDTTYKTNLYDMPFGLFIGVNNHFQSIVLGGVLMRNETIQSFKWVFTEFFRLMCGKHPKTTLTDQCRAMEVAIKDVLPNTTHIWCKWHVLCKAKQRIGPMYSKKSEFKKEFHKIVDNMWSIEEFEQAWQQMLDKYKLHKNAFLEHIYDTRNRWAKPWLKGIFCAKQTSTQRSESGNSMIKRYAGRSCPMHQFVQMYQRLQFDQECDESMEDQLSKLGGRRVIYNIPLEAHAAQIYTRNMYEKFCDLIFFDSGDFIAMEIIPR